MRSSMMRSRIPRTGLLNAFTTATDTSSAIRKVAMSSEKNIENSEKGPGLSGRAAFITQHQVKFKKQTASARLRREEDNKNLSVAASQPMLMRLHVTR